MFIHTPDPIIWKLQNVILGSYYLPMLSMVWRPWAPPKCNTFAWLVIQNHVWTLDRLHKWGWPNYGLCKLCNQVQESAADLLLHCRFSQIIWINLENWIGLVDMQPHNWSTICNMKAWWRLEGCHPKKRTREESSSFSCYACFLEI
jgi:hypothetical protein